MKSKQLELFKQKRKLHKKWFTHDFRINPYFSKNLKKNLYEMLPTYNTKTKNSDME